MRREPKVSFCKCTCMWCRPSFPEHWCPSCEAPPECPRKWPASAERQLQPHATACSLSAQSACSCRSFATRKKMQRAKNADGSPLMAPRDTTPHSDVKRCCPGVQGCWQELVVGMPSRAGVTLNSLHRDAGQTFFTQ